MPRKKTYITPDGICDTDQCGKNSEWFGEWNGGHFQGITYEWCATCWPSNRQFTDNARQNKELATEEEFWKEFHA